jgi:hypothetical protein
MPRTAFRPETHGFAFVNSWQLDAEEVDEVRSVFTNGIADTRKILRRIPGGRLLWRALRDVRTEMTTWINESLVEPYGLCGGMAFAALDYFRRDLELPRGAERGLPTNYTSDGQQLREYLRKRLIDSLGLNVGTFLSWMAIQHRISPKGVLRGGPGWLLAESKKQWSILKKDVEAGRPRPIGLVGTANDPTLNHQVLAYGYDDPGDGTGTIYLYDMNCPGREQTIQLDFRGKVLEAEEDCRSSGRGSLRGFFCETYIPELNPPRIDWP